MTEAFTTVELSDPALEHDGLRLATVKSGHLHARTDVSLWIPKADRIDILLILLHGVYGSHWVWSMKGGAHRIAQRMVDSHEIAPLVIAMPSDGLIEDGSAYLTWPQRADVERWILDEVPAIARIAAPSLSPTAKIAIAGLSMGGYAALRLGSKYPERFSAVSAHSAFMDIAEISAFTNTPLTKYLSTAPHEELSVAYWLGNHRDRLPPIRFDCGLEDVLLPSNRQLHQYLSGQSIAHEYAEFPGGHDWFYWQAHVARTLQHVDRYSRPEVSHDTL